MVVIEAKPKDPRYSHPGTGGDIRLFRAKWPPRDTPDFWCVLCTEAPRKRRALCWSCHRKLRHANVKLPGTINEASVLKLIIAALVRLTPDDLAKVKAAIP